MAYKAQLVVRATTKEGVEIIEKVKERASQEGKTFSDMAVELLTFAIQGGMIAASAPPPASPAAEPKEPASVEAKEKEETKADDEPVIPLPEDLGPPVDPKLPPKEIVRAYIERREESGELAAARILMDFFAVAGPKAGGQLRKLLLEEFDDLEYEELMEPVKKSKEYRAYIDRAISGTPTLYSTLS